MLMMNVELLCARQVKLTKIASDPFSEHEHRGIKRVVDNTLRKRIEDLINGFLQI